MMYIQGTTNHGMRRVSQHAGCKWFLSVYVSYEYARHMGKLRQEPDGAEQTSQRYLTRAGDFLHCDVSVSQQLTQS